MLTVSSKQNKHGNILLNSNSFRMNLQTLFQDFNPSKFVVHTFLLIFTILFALKLDHSITWSYWCVFVPIWIWKGLVILGASVGSYIWWRYPHFRGKGQHDGTAIYCRRDVTYKPRLEGEAYIHYKSMLISLALHLILLMFELLVCDKLQSGRHLWILVFIPLIFISIVSIAVCIWAVKHDRSFELELFCAVNVLQFIFLALRLDQFISWSWEVIFVPLWIVMCLSLVGVLYTIIFAAILMRTPEVSAQQRRASFHSALGYTFLVIPILVFQVLLANKLDDDIKLPYIVVASPLFISFLTLIIMSFSAKGCNKWWFGMRKDFCSFVLGVFPLLQEYANISYYPEHRREGVELEQSEKMDLAYLRKADHLKPILPIVSIEMPD